VRGDDRVAAIDDALDGRVVRHVAGDHLDARLLLGAAVLRSRRPFASSSGRPLRVQGHHVMPAAEQLRDDRAAGKARRAGDQHLHGWMVALAF
jgi:hypothetical protein